jgi:hypothetical protein
MPKTIDKATAVGRLTDQLKEAKAELKTLGDPKRSPKAAEVAGRVAALTATIKVVKAIAEPTEPTAPNGSQTVTAAAEIV